MRVAKVPEKAKWIAPCDLPKDRSLTQTAYFKAVLHVDQPYTDQKMIVHISANQRYCLYVDGVPILNGPCKGDRWHQYCDEIDIAPYCSHGENVIGIKVTAHPAQEGQDGEYTPEIGPWSITSNAAGPMLIFWCDWTDEYTTGVYPWMSKTDDAITWRFNSEVAIMGGTEEVYGEKLAPIKGWADRSDSDGFSSAVAKWDNNVSYGQIPKLYLYERPIKYLSRVNLELDDYEKAKMEITVPANSTREIVLDMKQLTTSYVTINTEKGKGSKITLLYSEGYAKTDDKGRQKKWDRCDESGVLTGVIDIYHCGGGTESYTPFWFRTFRFVSITVETSSEELILFPLELVETRYPMESKVDFESVACGNWLDPLWNISLRTLSLCMHETYEDCPFYEQLQYTMDTRLQMLFTYAVSNDVSMARRTLYDYHSSLLPEGILQSRYPSNNMQVIPVFALHWILMLKDYVWETGDLEYIKPLRFTLESVLDWFRRKKGTNGLVERLGYWDFADWTKEWEDIAGTPRATKYGPSTINNLVYAYVLQEAAELMDVLGMTQIAGNYRTESEEIKEIVNNLCWSNEKQMYREGPSYSEYTQHAQVFAVLSGAIKGSAAKKLMEHTIEDHSLIKCSFVMQFYVYRALEEAGLYEKTEELWELWKDLLDLNLSTVPEIPGPSARSDCHAWGALLLHELPRKFLGVAPLKPGYEKIRIKPMGYFIGDISGSVPTPHGSVTVTWKYESETGDFNIKGHMPVAAEIYLPDGTKMNGVIGSFEKTVKLKDIDM